MTDKKITYIDEINLFSLGFVEPGEHMMKVQVLKVRDNKTPDKNNKLTYDHPKTK